LLSLQSEYQTLVTYLKEKVEFNKYAAQLLYDNNYYAPSVHCAYYSCFQFLKYLIKEKLNISYQQQSSEISNQRLHTHVYVKDKILTQVSNIEPDTNKFRDIRTKLIDLQLLRIKSDYENVLIDENSSRKALQYSEELKKYFKEKIV